MFEYKIVSPLTTLWDMKASEILLNGFGKEGWELVVIMGNFYYFKRSKTPNV